MPPHDGADRGEIGDGAGRALVVRDEDGPVFRRSEPLGDGIGIGRRAPLDVEPVDAQAHRGGDLAKTLAELALHDDEDALARRRHVDERRLHGAGARGGHHEDLALRAEERPREALDLLVGGVELGAAMVDDGGSAIASATRCGTAVGPGSRTR